jgi:hypothetical protein
MSEERDWALKSLTDDLMHHFREEKWATDGIEIFDACYLLSAGDAAEYGVVLYRDAAGKAHVWTAIQYQDLWSSEQALDVVERRADGYERLAARSRDFASKARAALAQNKDAHDDR